MATSLQPQTLRVGDRVVAKMPLQYGLESPGRVYTIETGTRGKVLELQPGDIAVIGFDCHPVGFKLWNEAKTVDAAVEILQNPYAVPPLRSDSPRFCTSMESAIAAAMVMSREMGLWTVRVYRLEDGQLLVQEERDEPPAGGVSLFELVVAPCACGGDLETHDRRCPELVTWSGR